MNEYRQGMENGREEGMNRESHTGMEEIRMEKGMGTEMRMENDRRMEGIAGTQQGVAAVTMQGTAAMDGSPAEGMAPGAGTEMNGFFFDPGSGVQIPAAGNTEESSDRLGELAESGVQKIVEAVFGELRRAGSAAGNTVEGFSCDGSTCEDCVYAKDCVGRMILDMIVDIRSLKGMLSEADRLMPLMSIPSPRIHKSAGKVMESYCERADGILSKWSDYFYESETNPLTKQNEVQ